MIYRLHMCFRYRHTIIMLLLIQQLDVYQYIHECTYVHADLKGANILLGYGKSGGGQAYLVDFGLASHYTTKDFKPDPKKMHNGTIEYTSRDAHQVKQYISREIYSISDHLMFQRRVFQRCVVTLKFWPTISFNGVAYHCHGNRPVCSHHRQKSKQPRKNSCATWMHR